MLGCCNPDKSLLFFMAFDLSALCMRLDQSCQTNVHSDFKTQSPSEVLWLVQRYLGFFWKLGHLQSDLMTTGESLRKCGGFAADDSVAWLRVVGVAQEWGTHPQGVSLTKRQTSWGPTFGFWQILILWITCGIGLSWLGSSVVSIMLTKKLTKVAIPCFDHQILSDLPNSSLGPKASPLPCSERGKWHGGGCLMFENRDNLNSYIYIYICIHIKSRMAIFHKEHWVLKQWRFAGEKARCFTPCSQVACGVRVDGLQSKAEWNGRLGSIIGPSVPSTERPGGWLAGRVQQFFPVAEGADGEEWKLDKLQ